MDLFKETSEACLSKTIKVREYKNKSFFAHCFLAFFEPCFEFNNFQVFLEPNSMQPSLEKKREFFLVSFLFYLSSYFWFFFPVLLFLWPWSPQEQLLLLKLLCCWVSHTACPTGFITVFPIYRHSLLSGKTQKGTPWHRAFSLIHVLLKTRRMSACPCCWPLCFLESIAQKKGWTNVAHCSICSLPLQIPHIRFNFMLSSGAYSQKRGNWHGS